MLKLIIGTDWVSNQNAILDLLSCDVEAEQSGRILMVPELISHDTERRLCQKAGQTCSRYAEVLSFSRLGERVASSCRHSVQECLDDGGRLVAMAAAVQQLHSRLKSYASVGTRPEFLADLVDAVDEFKRCCITSADLSFASKQLQGNLAQKTEELALILDAYNTVCARGKRDPRDEMDWLLEELEDCDYAQKHVFYVDGFPDFTRQHLAILEHLIHNSPCVTVSLNCDTPGSRNLSFEKAGNTAMELLKIAEQVGVEADIKVIQPRNTAVMTVAKSLFQGDIKQQQVPLHVSRYESVNTECIAVAERISQLAGSGCRYRDIAVVCSDMPVYKNILDMIFNQAGIPAYISGTEDILENFLVDTIVSALDVVVNGFEQADVLRYLKSVLSPLDQDTIDLVENYVILWGISGSKWLSDWQEHPEGFDGKWDDRADALISSLNNARKAVISPLEELNKALRTGTTVGKQVRAVYQFMVRVDFQSKLSQLADDFSDAKEDRSTQILLQLWDILISALEQMYDVLKDTLWDISVFTKLFKLLLSQYKVGTIPTVLDSVIIGPVSAMRCQQVKHLFVLGATEGALPGYSGSAGILSDQERMALRDLGVPLTGGSVDGLQAEFAEIYGVFCGAEESVSISIPTGQPSFVYRRLLKMAGEEEVNDSLPHTVLTNTQSVAALVVREGNPKAAEELGIQNAYDNIVQHANHTLASVSKERIRSLYGEKLRLSASQVDKQADCRLSYFLRYGIRATERKTLSIDPAEFGTYVHAVLEETAAEVMERGGFGAMELEDVLAIAQKYSQSYAQDRFGQFASERLAYLFQRNNQELMMIVEELWCELSCSKFTPVEFELGFGENEKLPAISIMGKAMDAELRGFVDRVDTWQVEDRTYFRVVDYKTGKKDFDYCDVFNGYGLQMLLYMFALKQGGEVLLGDKRIPAGVQYFPARVPYISVECRLDSGQVLADRNKLWKRSGMLLADEDVLNAMEPNDTWYRLSCSRKKGGVLSGDVANETQLDLLSGYVFHLLSKLVDDIASGNVTPNPYTRGSSHDACAYCPYGAICHSTEVAGRRNYKTMSKERFWDEVEKEMKDRG